MASVNASNRALDARPDRVDYNDRIYLPKLTSLPARYPDIDFIHEKLDSYKELVLDQGDEGACAGFGLAALINYLQWKKSLDTGEPVVPVSPRMLHTMARFYDEWPGEDYLGTSCRGAMKGWYRHGVCSEKLWPYRRSPRHKATFIEPDPEWQQNAATLPLGAYYRVRKESITDMQSALNEVGALYVSAKYHDGWDEVDDNQKEPPVITLSPRSSGAHIFALVGYEPRGFIMQNSWGKRWGYNGFAILTYEDWLINSEDAWVAVLGAPMVIDGTRPTVNVRARRRVGLVAVAARPLASPKKTRKARGEVLAPADAYQHTVVIGNNGNPLNRFLDIETALKAVAESVHALPLKWLRENKSRKVVIFAQGGLTTEHAAIDRVRALAPQFKANGIYPIFLTWRVGFKDTLARLIDQAVTEYLMPAATFSQLGLDPAKTAISLGLDPEGSNALFAGGEQSSESRDQSVEVACQELMVKPIWMQMKRNAETAQTSPGALGEIAKNLKKLDKAVPKLEVHLVGHSAGAILLGHLLKKITPMRLPVTTCTLYAPACTVSFACKYYIKAMGKGGPLRIQNFFVDILSDSREQDDSIGPYKKSLLYLVSRGLEDLHGLPILGMEKVWDEEKWPDWPDDVEDRYLTELKQWRKFCRGRATVSVHNTFRHGRHKIPASHLDFDRDTGIIKDTLNRVRGKPKRRTRS